MSSAVCSPFPGTISLWVTPCEHARTTPLTLPLGTTTLQRALETQLMAKCEAISANKPSLQNWNQPLPIAASTSVHLVGLLAWTKSAKGAKRCRGRGTNKAERAVSLICVRGPAAAKWTRLLGAGVGTDLGPRSGDTGSGRQRTHPAVRLDSLTPRFMDYSTC